MATYLETEKDREGKSEIQYMETKVYEESKKGVQRLGD